MVVIFTGEPSSKAFDSALVFASVLRRAGLQCFIDENVVPGKINRHQRYEAAEILRPTQKDHVRNVIILAAQNICDELLARLRECSATIDQNLIVVGRFQNLQDEVSVRSKIAYAAGIEPILINLEEAQPRPLLPKTNAPLLVARYEEPAWPDRPRACVFLPEEMVGESDTLPYLAMLAAGGRVSLSLITSAIAKQNIKQSRYADLSVYSYTELSPYALADQTEIAVICGPGAPGERMAHLCLGVLQRSGVVVDATEKALLAASGAPVLRGPMAAGGLVPFLEDRVLPNRDAIRKEVRESRWLAKQSLELVTDLLWQDARPPEPRRKASIARRTVFVPTNGVGLGHAQRCALVAAEARSSEAIEFAAFPSCVSLLSAKGFEVTPLVQKSAQHSEPYANDILNYRRLVRLLGCEDRLVFDGVHVFDSIYRSIVEKQIDAVWIRRGLWRRNQSNEQALDRERCFRAVVVPGEAFDELNSAYSFGSAIYPVGPIVQQREMGADDVRNTRKTLAQNLASDFDKLVVTMLGGGVAADRAPQLHLLCAMLEEYSDVLHLVVVWPNATVSPGVTGWDRTKVVRSLDALGLCMAADFVITAVGYNSFHEVLYNRVPAIFLPQTAPYMDDQERRGLAASERGLAATVMPNDLLLLEREVRSFAEGPKAEEIRSRLAEVELPRRGNADAARIIFGGGRLDAR